MPQTKTPPTQFAQVLDKRNLSQADVVRGSGLPKQTVNDIYLGKRSPNTATARKIARFLGMTIDALFGGEEGCEDVQAERTPGDPVPVW